ncbi:MAG: PHP domain-containing protein [Christensenellaceae bacterium]
MILTADYHTHTPYSHGKGTVEENAARAKELGLKQIGITDHGFSHLAFGLKRKKVPDLIADCKRASEKLGIDVLVGMESNIRGISGLTDLTEEDYDDFDLFICGKHVFIAYETFPIGCIISAAILRWINSGAGRRKNWWNATRGRISI